MRTFVGFAALLALAGTSLLLADKDEDKKKTEPADNSRCFVCHGNYKKDKFTLKHAKKGIGCERCHGSSDAHCEDEEHLTPPDIMYARQRVPSACLGCHDIDKVKKEHREEEVEADYEGKKNVCTDCHGKGHRLEKRNVRWDKVTRKLLPSTQPASQPASGDKS